MRYKNIFISMLIVLNLLFGKFELFAYAESLYVPAEITVVVNSSTTSKTQIQVATGWVGKSWMSQEGISQGAYKVGVYKDGRVVSLDGKLDFTPWDDSLDQSLRIYIRYPDAQHNGADALLYTKNGDVVTYGNQGYLDFGSGFSPGSFVGGNNIQIISSDGNWQSWTPLPQYFLIHVTQITPDTRIQISNYYAGIKWVSQPILAKGDFLVRADPDGFVRSIDSKLAFTKSSEAKDSSLAVYILKPTNENGADYNRYDWSSANNPNGAIILSSSGYINLTTGATNSSSTGNNINITYQKEVLFPEKFMLRLNLESVTSKTFIHTAFYWKRVIYRSQIGVSPGEYWIQVLPDPDPNNPAAAPSLLSVDHRLVFDKIPCRETPDHVFAVFIALPNRPEQGFDTIGFQHNFRRPNTYQAMLGENKTGPDLGLGYVFTNVLNPADDITNYPTTPMETLTGGNYIVVTDAGLIIGRVVNQAGQPLSGAQVRIDNIVQITDTNGEFVFSQMVAGVYTLAYNFNGQAQTQLIEVKAGEPTYTPWVVFQGESIISAPAGSAPIPKNKKKSRRRVRRRRR